MIDETIDSIGEQITSHKQSLESGLTALQNWFDENAPILTETERDSFSKRLSVEKETQVRDGKPYGDDRSLVLSVLRLHTMRLLYRYDEQKRGKPTYADSSPYGRARERLQMALREVEMALNEARVDTAIASAHQILNDSRSNRRWLQDALTRLQTVSHKNLIQLAEAVPMPDPPPLNLLQRVMFWATGIKQEELARRSLASLRQIAELQNHQLVEMATLLVQSFAANNDTIGSEQAQALLAKLTPD